MRPIELLAPARNLECGIEAIRHGADAVYIGAPRFGARAAAGNSVEDIGRLVRYAHLFGVRIYVALNTLLRDDELPAVQNLVNALAAIHVDALIVQDHRIAAPLPLHSSTQQDNRTIADVQARQDAGYTQTVLARELSLEQIRAIHAAVPGMPLEVFVHGALCVSYSGRCYASEYCFGRSANRGECAQFCRLPFDLVDAQGRVVGDANGRPVRQRHLLSLKDMNRADALEALMDAGVSSFKIEGRLKDVAYVKNVTAYYRQRLDAILARRADAYRRSSYGRSDITFTPNPLRSFNRGFTDYFLHGRTRDMACHATPKAIGEPVGTVKDVRANWLTVAGTTTFANGDGLCYFTPEGRLEGFRVNRIDPQGRLYVNDASTLAALRLRTRLYRNQDQAFEHLLSRPTATRRLAVRWLLEDRVGTPAPAHAEEQQAFRLTLTDEMGRTCQRTFAHPHERACTPQAGAIIRQLTRLGNTPFMATADDVTLSLSAEWFIPASVLADWRRQLCEELENADCLESSKRPENSDRSNHPVPSSPSGISPSTPLMTCRYCLRHALGQCLKERPTLREPLALRLTDGRTFPLHFDCARCEMQILRPRP